MIYILSISKGGGKPKPRGANDPPPPPPPPPRKKPCNGKCNVMHKFINKFAMTTMAYWKNGSTGNQQFSQHACIAHTATTALTSTFLTWAGGLFGTFFPHVILCSTYYIAATVALTSTLDERQTACPGEVVTYTCSVTQAVLLDWTAEPFIDERNRLQFSRSTPAEDKIIDCSDNSTVPCADLDYRTTLTSVGPAQRGFADMTSTFRFTASARVNGTVVQCNGSTATGVQTANSTLSVTGMLHPQSAY